VRAGDRGAVLRSVRVTLGLVTIEREPPSGALSAPAAQRSWRAGGRLRENAPSSPRAELREALTSPRSVAAREHRRRRECCSRRPIGSGVGYVSVCCRSCVNACVTLLGQKFSAALARLAVWRALAGEDVSPGGRAFCDGSPRPSRRRAATLRSRTG
jgi:hypothetical protein